MMTSICRSAEEYRRGWSPRALNVCCMFGILSAAAFGQAVTPDRAAQRANAPEFPPGYNPDKVSVLVQMEAGAARGLVRAFAADQGGLVRYEYKNAMPDMLNLRNLPKGAIQALRNMKGVKTVELDEYHPYLLNLHDGTPLINALQSQVTAAGFSADGTGVRVCVCDTGIDMDHVMYSSRIDTAASFDFANNDNNPDDDNGHGSHVSGIAVGGAGLSVDFGCGAGSQAFQGIAPGATLIGAKILNQFGGGSDSDIIAGIDHCADQSASGGQADVINLSIGIGAFTTGACTHSWAVASNNAVANGVVVVAASGNENNSNAMGSPACGADVIAVGATYKANYPTCEDNTTNWNWGNCIDNSPVQDQIVCFSNESDFLDVSAPGANMWSASNAAGGSSITGQSGTSMASPAVAGLAALILDADPSLNPAQVRQIIRDGAIDMGPAGFDRAYGWGRIDIIGSLSLVTPCQVNGDCDDGLFCNGAETCNAGSCQAGSDPCPGEDCDEVGDVCVPLVCNNDTVCDPGEDCNNCSNDCFSGSGAVCGNNVCETANGEDCLSCPGDCNGTQGGRPSNRYCCGDGSTGQGAVDCSDNRCTGSGNTCTSTPAQGSCCGDGTCEGSEDSCNCAVDCGAPAAENCSNGVDDDCDGDIDCNDADCSGDPACVDPCGDGTCGAGEDQCNCSLDCGTPPGTETSCTDGTDNDCDGQTDCNDSDCASDPACSCGAKNDPCSQGSDCCSGICKNNGSCR